MPFYYTLYNIILWNLCFFLTYKQINRVGIENIPSVRSARSALYFRIFVLIFFFSLFTFFGGDNEKYREFVEVGFKDAAVYLHYPLEPLYVFLASISKGSFVIWKAIVYGGAILITYLSCKRFSLDNYGTLFFFVIFAMISYGATRAVLAYSIFLYGISFIIVDKNKWQKLIGIGVIGLSYFAHSSMLLPILLIPISLLFHLSRKRVIILLCMLPFVVIIINHVPSLFESGFFDFADQASYKYQVYVDQYEDTGYNSSYGSFLTRVYNIVNIALYLLSIYVAIKAPSNSLDKSSGNIIITVSFFLMYIGLAFNMSSIPAGGIFYARYFTMAPFFLYIVMPLCLVFSNKKYLKLIAFLGFIRCNLFLFTEMYYNYMH